MHKSKFSNAANVEQLKLENDSQFVHMSYRDCAFSHVALPVYLGTL